MRRASAVCALLATVLFAREGRAYRPFDGTDADVASQNDVELEIGPVGYLRASHTSALVAPSVIANYGFLPRWELVLQGEGLFAQRAAPRFTDGGAFLKYVLREGSLQAGHTGWSLVTEFGVLLPENFSGDGGVYLGFVASRAWRMLTMHLNVSLARATDGRADVFTGVIVEAVPRARIRPVAELFVDTHGGIATPSVLVGFIIRCSEHASLDAATRIAWQSGEPRASDASSSNVRSAPDERRRRKRKRCSPDPRAHPTSGRAGVRRPSSAAICR